VSQKEFFNKRKIVDTPIVSETDIETDFQTKPFLQPLYDKVNALVLETRKKEEEESKNPKVKQTITSQDTEVNLFRHQSVSFDKLVNRYNDIRGKMIHQPKEKNLPLPVLSREDALETYGNSQTLLIGITQICELGDEIWLVGNLDRTATIALDLKGFKPFFLLNCENESKATVAHANKLQSILNLPKNCPSGVQQKIKRHKPTEEPPEPVPEIRIRRDQLKGDIYDGRIKTSYFQIFFDSMVSFRHYREKLACNQIKIGYSPKLYHEQHSLTQMFFNLHEGRYFGFIEVDTADCNLLPETAWTELELLHELDMKIQNEYPDPNDAAAPSLEKPTEELPKFKSLLVGSLDVKKLKAKELEAPIPFLVANYDIETLCWESVLNQRAQTELPYMEKEKEEEQKPKCSKILQGLFPLATKPDDAVILIATHIMVYGDKDSFLKVIHCLGKPNMKPETLKDIVLYTFEKSEEKKMLEHWSSMLRQFDIEWLSGYNSINYDTPYIFQRAKVLGSEKIKHDLSRFVALPNERIKKPFRYRDCVAKERKGKAMGTFGKPMMPQVDLPGMIQFDALNVIKQLEKMDSYSLKEVANVLLDGKLKKKDMEYENIAPYWEVGGDHLEKLVDYCKFDVLVLEAVIISRFLLGHSIEVARATLTSVSAQMLQGQQIRTWNLLVNYAHNNNWVLDENERLRAQESFGLKVDRIPKYLKKFLPKDDDGFLESYAGDRIKYTGATVLIPKPGLYKTHISTADFASLYPSIMISHSLDFSTWVDVRYGPKGEIWFPLHDKNHQERDLTKYIVWYVETEERPNLAPDDKRDIFMVVRDAEAEKTTCFVQNRGAMLPNILTDLLALRKKVKLQLSVAEENKNKFLEKVLDARQSAIKVTCNACYGFCGAMKGYHGMVSIASTTCVIGRLKIEQTKKVFEEELGGNCIYGDTDSVFIEFLWLEKQKGKTRDEIRRQIMEISKMGCNLVSSRLPKPMKLEFEKLMTPYLLIQKKCYVGKWIWPKPKLFFKGTSNIRRDSCKLARECVGKVLKAVIDTPDDKEKILEPMLKALERMVDPNLNINELVRTVAKRDSYKKEELMQVKLIQKIEKRRGVPLDVGSRIPFIITLPQGGKRVRTKKDGVMNDGEDVEYAIKNKIRADRSYYVERQIFNPIDRYISSLIKTEEIYKPVKKALDKIYAQDSKLKTMDMFLMTK